MAYHANSFSMLLPDEIILPNIDFIIGPEDAPIELLQVAPESYNTGDIINDGQWITYGFTFQTEPGVTDISFAIRNNAPGGGGNDFLLDNISFQVCGPTLDIFRSEICADAPRGNFSRTPKRKRLTRSLP